jgi:hypothetical protein
MAANRDRYKKMDSIRKVGSYGGWWMLFTNADQNVDKTAVMNRISGHVQNRGKYHQVLNRLLNNGSIYLYT